jgi:hypothetical protein
MAPREMASLQRVVGNRTLLQLLQPKLKVDAPGNMAEDEADSVADQVMTMPDPQSAAAPAVVRRHNKAEDELQENPEIQPVSSDSGFETSDDFSAQIAANKGEGSRLPGKTRKFMEPRFGADFSSVRVHTDGDAAQLSQAVKAQAFTHGNDIYFNENEYNPDSSEGKQLLAHELTHTVQQQGGRAQPGQKKLEVSTPDDSAEVEADQVANAISGGQAVSVSAVSGAVSIARKKEAATPFSGWAGEADVRAAEAGREAGGFSPINVSTDYTIKQAERKENQMDSFRKADIPFVYNNQEHYAYKKLIELRQEYLNDVSRITLARGAFNDFVIPGTLASKSTAQFKRIQAELGYFDDINPAEELTTKERTTLAKNLDKKKMNEMNADISSKEQLARGKRKEILGTSHNIQAAMQRRAGVLATEAKGKAGERRPRSMRRSRRSRKARRPSAKLLRRYRSRGLVGLRLSARSPRAAQRGLRVG